MIVLCCSETAFIIIMENLSPNHYQTPMMNFDQVKKSFIRNQKNAKNVLDINKEAGRMGDFKFIIYRRKLLLLLLTMQAKLVMTSLANLHAHFWNKVQDEERGGFWVLQRRLKHQGISPPLPLGCIHELYIQRLRLLMRPGDGSQRGFLNCGIRFKNQTQRISAD